jgi:hypothetical protein
MIIPGSILSATAVIGSTLLLAACGGGDSSTVGTSGSGSPSGGSTTAASTGITAANMNAVAAEVAQAAVGLDKPSNGANNATDRNGGPGIALNAVDQVQTAQTVQASTPLPTITINCNQGGSATLKLQTASRSRLSSGDQLSLNASNCIQDNDQVNGGISINITSVTGTPSSTQPWNASLGVTFTGFSHNDGQDVDNLAGDVALTFNQTAPGVATFSVTGNSLTVADNKGGTTVSRTLNAYSVTGSVNANVFTYRTNFTLNGSIPNVGQGPFTITTTQDFVQQRGSAPTQGTLQVTASDKSTLTLTPVDANNVRIGLDQNGDGTIDLTTTTTWAQLRSLLL